MQECLLCKCQIPDEDSLCSCGFNFLSNEVEGQIQINEKLHWVKKLEIEKRLFELYKNHQSMTWIAREKLGKSKATLSLDMNLISSFQKYPKLANFRTKAEAQRFLRQWEFSAQKPSEIKEYFSKELELRDFLAKNWVNTDLGREWRLIAEEFDTKEVGRIDLLTQNRETDQWMIVELKLTKASDQVIGQVLRYMGWIKANKSSKQEVVGIIICNEIDQDLSYALPMTKNVNLYTYNYDGSTISLIKFDRQNYNVKKVTRLYEQMTEEDKLKFIERWRNILSVKRS
ncbi:MAG: PDDEXK nuclease domain-containing protein [Candidatus Marinimicrobia bacterium]|nr:PDDEXK nuclease domain-containing protein [Candidatus Neomarinimicrobiota bacterium]MCF7839224.1 PDDEXK nuclease domain-containing protein [Candidatus Neomarinimicrobiota bacterium]